jgi:hypothetical protein
MSVEAGAAAAAAAAELQRQEEEEMTRYTPKDLADGWEFKIIRSNSGAFRKPEKLQAMLDDEKLGGWTLVEKFDDCRVRLKRPAGTKVIPSDFADGYDPYRTNVGMSQAAIVMLVLGITAALGFCLLLFAILLSH